MLAPESRCIRRRGGAGMKESASLDYRERALSALLHRRYG